MVKQNQDFENQVFKALHKYFKKVQESYQKYHNNPYEADYIHRFRVDMRKMRVLFNFLKPFINKDIYETFNQSLRQLGRRLSPLRDLDTLIEECNELALAEPDLIDNYAEVFKYLEKERFKLVQSQSTKKTFKEFEGILEGAEGVLEQLVLFENINQTPSQKLFKKRYQHKMDKLDKEFKNLDISDYEAVHEVRKLAKKVRYTSVGFKKVLPNKERKEVKKRAKRVQEYLGEITDIHVSIEILEEYKQRTTNKRVEDSIQKIIDYHLNKSLTHSLIF